MSVHKWILPTLSEILALSESSLASCHSAKVERTVATDSDEDEVTTVSSTNQTDRARSQPERQWHVAIAALEQLLQSTLASPASTANHHSLAAPGLILAGPVPVLSPKLSSIPTWIFTAEWLKPGVGMPFQLPPATAMPTAPILSDKAELAPTALVLPLIPEDPLSNEQFCLVLTAQFNLVMVLGAAANPSSGAFLFSFEPEVVAQAWHALRGRIVLANPHPLSDLDALVEQYLSVPPDYRTVMEFSRLLLKNLPELPGEVENHTPAPHPAPLTLPPYSQSPKGVYSPLTSSSRPDVELLQAFAHEVRTPLTTIRTLTRLLLKRSDLAPDVIKHLKIVDRECTDQIDRMELLFQAAEMELATVKQTTNHLTAMSIDQVLQQSIPRWQQSASRRNLTLDVVLPQQLPSVVSDPRMLDRVLTSLIENFTRSLPAGSHIQVQVIPAGDQLKLQLLPQSQPGESDTLEKSPVLPTRKSLGQLLTFQPETGNISLNLTATKHLFQAIGGKLIVRQRPQQGEVLTIFLPTEFYHQSRGQINLSSPEKVRFC